MKIIKASVIDLKETHIFLKVKVILINKNNKLT